MNEPTLGQRIASKAAAWAVAADKEGWGLIDGHVTDRLWADLLTLCDRADAAERLANATLAMDAATDAWHDASPDDAEARRAYDDAAMAYEAARYAWRSETNA